jgi:hypothetical protein
MTDKEAITKELEELAGKFSEGWHEGIKIDASDIMLLSQAAEVLAQPEQEPVGYVQQSVLDWLYSKHRFSSAHTITTIAKSPTETEDVALYTDPPQRTWVGLTSHERMMCRSFYPDEAVAKTEAKLKEKNT